ncbi:hypothetical protein [Pseudooceanicola aestuarii]|uniref:hypothetical protein n=1 Tax=Pseudooceanicola aestuarii TaxID=2697319 RepID=UPI0013D88D4E|nr:hypothetical protein [Pseudooceanicola aestuarii]
MERIAYLVIGASVAVVLMTLLQSGYPGLTAQPAGAEVSRTDTPHMTMAPGAAPALAMTHQHPPREVSPDLPVPGVTHLMFPDIMGGYNVQILVRDFRFTPANINRDPQDNEGHAHIYVNGVKVARVYSDWYHLPAEFVQPGENEVKVTLNANDHGEWAVDGVPISSVVRIVLPTAGE